MPPSSENQDARITALEKSINSTDPDRPGLAMRVDRLEQADASRTRMFRWLSGGSLMGLGGVLYWLFGRGGNGP